MSGCSGGLGVALVDGGLLCEEGGVGWLWRRKQKGEVNRIVSSRFSV